MNDIMQDLCDRANDRGYTPLHEERGTIWDNESFSYTLSEGRYIVFAAAGSGIEDLDLRVSDRDGWLYEEDVEIDARPIVEFYLDQRTMVEIEVEAWAFRSGYDRDDFCLLLCEDF